METAEALNISEWIDSDSSAALIEARHDRIYVVWVGGDGDKPFFCINTATNALWWMDADHLVQDFDDAIVTIAAVSGSGSPTCPRCGAPLDDHNSRGECPPF